MNANADGPSSQHNAGETQQLDRARVIVELSDGFLRCDTMLP